MRTASFACRFCSCSCFLESPPGCTADAAVDACGCDTGAEDSAATFDVDATGRGRERGGGEGRCCTTSSERFEKSSAGNDVSPSSPGAGMSDQLGCRT